MWCVGGHKFGVKRTLTGQWWQEYILGRVCDPAGHTLGTTGVRASSKVGSPYDADLHKYWWARTVSNRRPLVCKGTGESEQVFCGVQHVQVRAGARVHLTPPCPPCSFVSWQLGDNLTNAPSTVTHAPTRQAGARGASAPRHQSGVGGPPGIPYTHSGVHRAGRVQTRFLGHSPTDDP